jgi:zinc protease
MRYKITNINIVTISFVFLLFITGSGCTQQTAASYKYLKYPKLGNIEIPKVERVTLSNGMQLFLLEDHELPLIEASAMIRTGSVYEPNDKIGLSAVVGSVMRTGGTTDKSGDQIDQQLEQIAASVGISIGLNSGGATLSVLKKDIDTGLNIFADVLMNPSFPDDKIELTKIQLRSSIARRNDIIDDIAVREYKKLIYGSQSVYARHSEYATIENITRDDLIAFHKRFFHPNNMMLALWGDFDTKEIIKKVEAAFKGWEKADSKLAPMPKVDYEFRQTVNIISRDDAHQSNIYLGHIGGMMNDPDYFALVVMNQILGANSFTNRLFKNVRTRLGLAYDVFGVYTARYDYPGVLYVGCQTKSESTVKAIKAMIDEVRKITQSEVTDEELALAKESYLNTFVFNFETKGQVVTRLMTYAYFDYPEDFLQKTKSAIEKVTKVDVLRVARKHLQPDKMQILVVGKPDEFGEPLSVLGQVKEIDITIPPAKKN